MLRYDSSTAEGTHARISKTLPRTESIPRTTDQKSNSWHIESALSKPGTILNS